MSIRMTNNHRDGHKKSSTSLINNQRDRQTIGPYFFLNKQPRDGTHASSVLLLITTEMDFLQLPGVDAHDVGDASREVFVHLVHGVPATLGARAVAVGPRALVQ